jgi:predicted transposase/invertase (TIGR01784 family)
LTSNSLTMSEKTNRYIDPLTDFGFKYFFGTELNKKILLKFLNAVFEGKKQIEDVVFMPVETDKDNPHGTHPSDLLCKEKSGKQFTLLLRRIERDSFSDSSREFMTRFFKELEASISKAQYQVKEHYLLGLLDFSFGDCEETYYREISFTRVDMKRIPSGMLGFKFLEVPEFFKTGKDLETDLDKWFYLLKHLRRLDNIPRWFQDEHFQEVFRTAEVASLTPDQQASYAAELKKKKKFFKVYNPDQAANEAMQKALDEGHLDHESKEYFLEVFRMGYDSGFEEGMLEIANELGTAL